MKNAPATSSASPGRSPVGSSGAVVLFGPVIVAVSAGIRRAGCEKRDRAGRSGPGARPRPGRRTVTDVEEVPELAFVRPLPGFGDLRRFVLVEVTASGEDGEDGEDGGEPVLFELRSLEEHAVRFLAAVPEN